jgi:hypothetical protein
MNDAARTGPDLSGTSIEGRYRLLSRREETLEHPCIERYRAEQLVLSRPVEVDILRVANGEGATLEERFRESWGRLASFDHPGFVPVIDLGMYQGCPFVVRPALEGRLLTADYTWPPDQVASMLAQVADAMGELHARGFLFRRLTTADILVNADGRPRITNLRAAVEAGEGDDERNDLGSLGTIGRELILNDHPLHAYLVKLSNPDLDERPKNAAQAAQELRTFSPRVDENTVELKQTVELDLSVLERPKLKLLAIAAVAAGIMAGGYFAVPQGREAPIAEIADVRTDNESIAARSRVLTNKGGASAAIEELERLIVEEDQYGNAALHSALAHALVRADRGVDALQHYSLVIKNDPRALQETDINELVGQLALPRKDGERAMDLTIALGDRAIPILNDVAADSLSDKLMRVRAQKALRQLRLLPRRSTPDEDRM